MELLIGHSLKWGRKLSLNVEEGKDDSSEDEENKINELCGDEDTSLDDYDEIDNKLKTILICIEGFLEFSKRIHNDEIPEDHLALSNEIKAQVNKVQSDLAKVNQDQTNQELSCFLQEADGILTSLENNELYKDFETNRALLIEDPNEAENVNQDTLIIVKYIKEKLYVLSNKFKELQEEKDKAEEEHQKEVALLQSQLKQEQDKYKDLKEAYDKLCKEQNQTSEDLQEHEKDSAAPKEETKEDTANEEIKDEIINSLVKEKEFEAPGENDQQQDWRLDASNQEAMESNQNLDKDQDHFQSESNVEDQQEGSDLDASAPKDPPASRDTSALKKTKVEEDKNPEIPEEEKTSLEEEKKTEQDSEGVTLVYKEEAYPNGDSYKGQFNAHTGKIHGQGTYLWKSGGKYIGQWKNGEEEGQGIMYYESGNMYEGEWVNGERHGTGLYKWKDGATYQGEWANGSENGQGIFKEPDGYSYEGEWKDGKSHGQGVECYASGAKYVGQFQNDSWHGEGVYTWKDGSTYQGHNENGKMNGYGVFINPNTGKICEGQWKDGLMHGEFTVILKDGERVTKYYDNGKKM